MMRVRPSVSERDIQRTVADYLRKVYPRVRFTATLGGMRTGDSDRSAAIRMRQAKAQGYSVGVPDLLIFKRREKNGRVFSGLALELKTPTGKLSKEQSRYMIDLVEEGWSACATHSVESAIECINIYMWGR